MANYGSNALVVKVDLADGGSLVDISAFVTSINGTTVEKITEDSTPFGASFMAELQVGMSKMEPVVLEGMYSDASAASGPEGLNPLGTHVVTRTLEITYGGTKKTTVECWLRKYERIPAIGKLTRYRATLNPTGTITEA